MKDHRLIDERSLAFARATVEKLTRDPLVIVQARENLNRWLSDCSARERPALLEWKAALDGPLEALIATLTGLDERATRLRQSSPFAGSLSTAERTAIIQEFQTRESARA